MGTSGSSGESETESAVAPEARQADAVVETSTAEAAVGGGAGVLLARAARGLQAPGERVPPPGRGRTPTRSRQVLALQRTAGNAATVRMLHRQHAVAEGPYLVLPQGRTPAEIARWMVARVHPGPGDTLAVLTPSQLFVFGTEQDPVQVGQPLERAPADQPSLSSGVWSRPHGSAWARLEELGSDSHDFWPATLTGVNGPEELVAVPSREAMKMMLKPGTFWLAVPDPRSLSTDDGKIEEVVVHEDRNWAMDQYTRANAAIEAIKQASSSQQRADIPAGSGSYSLPDRLIPWKRPTDGKWFVNVWVGTEPAPGVNKQHHTPLELKQGESTAELVRRIRAAAGALRAGLDPNASIAVKGGATGQAKFVGKAGPGEIEFPPDAPIDPTGGRATTSDPPFPARIVSHGAEGSSGNLEYEQTVNGATVNFTMDLDFAAVTSGFWEEFGARWQLIAYRWEIINISDLSLAAVKGKLIGPTNADVRRQIALLEEQAKAAEDPATADATSKAAAELVRKLKEGGKDPASGAGRDIGRDLANTWEDTKADVHDVGINPLTQGYLGLVAVSDLVQVGGALVSAGFSEAASPMSDRSIAFGQEGLYLLRCYAQPVISDADIERIEAKGLRPIIRPPSVAFLPIKVVPINVRAQQVNDAELTQIATLEEEVKHPPFPETAEEAQNRLGDAKAALADNNEEAINRALTAAEGELGRIQTWRGLQGKAPDDHPSDLRVWHAKLELNGIEFDSYEKDLKETQDKLRKMLGQVRKGNAGIKGRVFRPRITLVSELDGHVYTVVANLGEADRSKPGAYVWRLADVSGDDPIPPVYEGTGKTHDAAITNAFQLFSEKNEYGRGAIAVRMPPEQAFRTAVEDETLTVPTLWRSAPGFEQRAWKRLQDLATATEIAGLFVTGPLGVGLMAVGGIAGGVVAIHNMRKRAATGRFEWVDFQTGMDILAVVGAFLAVGGIATKGVQTVAEAAEAARLAKRARWAGAGAEAAGEASYMARVAKAADWTGRAIHMMGTGMLAGQVLTIPASTVLQLVKIDEAERAAEAAAAKTGHPETVDHAKYRAQRLEAVAGALRSIVVTARMVQLGGDPKAGWDPFEGAAPESPVTQGALRATTPETGLPADLHKVVGVEVDTALGQSNTVRVYYDVDPQTKVIVRVRMRIGAAATANDVRLHVPTARALLRYSGLSGRVRVLWSQLSALLGSREPPLHSRAWEAKLELQKLPDVIADRARTLADPKLTPAAREDLESELTHLEDQVDEHSATLAQMKVDQASGVPLEQGRGFIAAEGVTPAQQKARDAGLPEREGYHWRQLGDKWAIVRDDPSLPRLRWNPDTKTLDVVAEPAKPTSGSSSANTSGGGTAPSGGPAPTAPPPPAPAPTFGPQVRDRRTAGTGGISSIDELVNDRNETEVVIEGRLQTGMDRRRSTPGRPRAPNYNRQELWAILREEHPDLQLDTWEAAHLWGPGFGDEAAAGMMLAPRDVNQVWQNRGVEQFLRRLRKDAADLGLEVRVRAAARSQPRSFAGGLGDSLLQEAEYEFSVGEPGKPDTQKPYGHVSFSVDLPPGGKVHEPVVVRYTDSSWRR